MRYGKQINPLVDIFNNEKYAVIDFISGNSLSGRSRSRYPVTMGNHKTSSNFTIVSLSFKTKWRNRNTWC